MLINNINMSDFGIKMRNVNAQYYSQESRTNLLGCKNGLVSLRSAGVFRMAAWAWFW